MITTIVTSAAALKLATAVLAHVQRNSIKVTIAKPDGSKLEIETHGKESADQVVRLVNFIGMDERDSEASDSTTRPKLPSPDVDNKD